MPELVVILLQPKVSSRAVGQLTCCMGRKCTFRVCGPRSAHGCSASSGHRSGIAAILQDGSVVAWGHPWFGGDCSEARHQLRNVQQVRATGMAFAAILADESVVTWGRPDWGGDSSKAQHELRSVQQIQATERAFAAILQDGDNSTLEITQDCRLCCTPEWSQGCGRDPGYELCADGQSSL